ncbi:MAG: 3'-5' exonuclease, partial [Alphaproteobacteria bacterium]|nr:3'-5' exonuclease [Alphaproteobacteria bacterium]
MAAVVSADVVGYSRLMGVDETGTLAALRSHRAELIDGKIAEHGGRIVKTMGDGLLIEFPSVVDATQCMIEVQQGMAKRNEGVDEGQRIVFRIGINLGDIIIEGEDIHGDGVNIAARLQEISEPGGVAISRRVYEDVQDRLDVPFDDAGEQALKNIARPVNVWRWSTFSSASTSVKATEPVALPDKPSVAVLPFDNMSGDPEQDYFADGLTEEIITALSKISRMRVIARNSAFAYKGKALDLRQVASEMGVRFVLEGSIRSGGNRLRITAQLIDASDGSHIWAERFDRTIDDIFDIQDDITNPDLKSKDRNNSISEIERIISEELSDVNIIYMGDPIIQIGTVFYEYGTNKIFRHILVIAPEDNLEEKEICDDLDEITIEKCSSEENLLIQWNKIIKSQDPDFITGYNIFGFD